MPEQLWLLSLPRLSGVVVPWPTSALNYARQLTLTRESVAAKQKSVSIVGSALNSSPSRLFHVESY